MTTMAQTALGQAFSILFAIAGVAENGLHMISGSSDDSVGRMMMAKRLLTAQQLCSECCSYDGRY